MIIVKTTITMNKKLFWSSFIILFCAVLSFWVWYGEIFNRELAISIKMSAPEVEVVKAYWQNPNTDPNAYEPIIINPVESKHWNLTIEALGEKNSQSEGLEVVILDIKTPQGQADWSRGNFEGKWEFRDDSSGPQGQVAIAHSNKPEFESDSSQSQSLSITVEGGDLEIKLFGHASSGKVKITADDRTEEVDLFHREGKHEIVSFPAMKQGDRLSRQYLIQIPDTVWGKLQLIPEDGGSINIESIQINGQNAIAGKENQYTIPFRWNNRFLLSLTTTGILLITIGLVAFGRFKDAAIVLVFTILQGFWMAFFEVSTVGILNTLPTFLFLLIWYFFSKTQYKKKSFWFLFFLGFLLTLRLPSTLWRPLEVLQWMIFGSIIILAMRKTISWYRDRKKLALLIVTFIIIWFNSFTHISQDSPLTYVNRASTYYYECPYETYIIMVNCDIGHYIAEEKIFSHGVATQGLRFESVYYRRFFYGYLASLISFDGHRWIANFSLNLLFWLWTCIAIDRICWLLNLGNRVAAIAMLCIASSWGFVSWVAQPSMHLLAYAYVAIAMWATLEIIFNPTSKKKILLASLLIPSILVYDLYAIILTSFLILFLYKQRLLATFILIAQIFLSLIWKEVYLLNVLGTLGDTSNADFISKNLNAWWEILKTFDFAAGIYWLGRGIQSFVYGNMIFGAFAIIVLIIGLLRKWRQDRISHRDKLLLIFSFVLSVLVLMSAVVTIPEASKWGLKIMLPRLSFYTYPIATLALAILGNRFLSKRAYIIPIITFLIANLDITGLASVAVFFDYGAVGIYWK